MKSVNWYKCVGEGEGDNGDFLGFLTNFLVQYLPPSFQLPPPLPFFFRRPLDRYEYREASKLPP